jgi:hypothetical protein
MDEHIVIRMASGMIRRGELDQLMDLQRSVVHMKLDHAYMLQKLYLNACVDGNPEIIRYFFQLAHACTEIDRIRIRHAFTYSKYIIRRFSSDELEMLLQKLYPLPPPARTNRVREFPS